MIKRVVNQTLVAALHLGKESPAGKEELVQQRFVGAWGTLCRMGYLGCEHRYEGKGYPKGTEERKAHHE